MKIADEILKRGFSGRIIRSAPLADFTTYRIGGPARVLVEPSCNEDVKIVLQFVADAAVPLYVLGAGSKVLAPDEEVKGIVMVMGDLFAKIDIFEQEIIASAGVPNALLAESAAIEGFAGLEWIYDIPGRVGGSLVQNAGMNEYSISDNLDEVTFVRRSGEVSTLKKENLQFGYRSSSFKTWGDRVIVSAKFRFQAKGQPAEILRNMEEIAGRRHSKFPMSHPTCGSVFKRPEGHYPGKLIEECGLGGRKVGGAMISRRHHNFIVNRGGATAADVKALVDLITDTVEKTRGVKLERELIYLEEILFGGASSGK